MLELKDKELMKNPEVQEYMFKLNELLIAAMSPVFKSDLYKEGLTELAVTGKTYKLGEAFKNLSITKGDNMCDELCKYDAPCEYCAANKENNGQ